MTPDKELIARFKQGGSQGEKAFTELVRRYQEKVYWVCRRMLKSHDDADDVAQNVFIKVHNGLSGFNEEAEFFTWIYRIAVNETINFIRAQKVRSAEPIDDLIHEPSDAAERPDESIEREEQRRLIQEAIDTLPEKQKVVFMLRYYDELAYEEIAEMLGTSVGGLKANYFHAFKKIEGYLKLRLKQH